MDDDDYDDDDDSGTVACPSCGAEVYEDAERCPSCGDYLVHSTSPWAGKPWLWAFVGLLGIVAVIYASVRWAF